MDKKEEDQRMKELKDRYIRFDWAIKRLLRQKANFGVLEGFLTVFLGEKITIVELLESEAMEKDTEVLNKYKIFASYIISNRYSMAWRKP